MEQFEITFDDVVEATSDATAEAALDELINKRTEGAILRETGMLAEYAINKAVAKAARENEQKQKGRIEEIMMRDYSERGTKTRDININGDGPKIATATLVMSKQKYEITNEEEFGEFIEGNGFGRVKHVLDPRYSETVYSMLAANLEPEDFEYMFNHEIQVQSSDFDKLVRNLDSETCAIAGTDTAIPGVRPAKPRPTHVMIKTEPIEDVLRAQMINGADTVATLIAGKSLN